MWLDIRPTIFSLRNSTSCSHSHTLMSPLPDMGRGGILTIFALQRTRLNKLDVDILADIDLVVSGDIELLPDGWQDRVVI